MGSKPEEDHKWHRDVFQESNIKNNYHIQGLKLKWFAGAS